jgi:putative transposase
MSTPDLAIALGVSPRAMQLRIVNEGWPTRKAASAGKRGKPAYEVAVAALPEDIRIALALNTPSTPVQPIRGGASLLVRPAAAVASLATLPGDAMEARAFVLGELNRFQAEARVSIGQAREAFIAAWTCNGIAAPDWVKAQLRVLSLSTLRRWERKRLRAGTAGLADRRALNRKGKGQIDSDTVLRDFLVTNIHARPHITALQLMKAVEARFERRLALRTLQHWLAAWRAQHVIELAAITDPDAARSRYLPAFGDAGRRVLRLNQLWELDSSPADVMIRGGRHSIVGVIDVFSRRAMVLVSRTSTAAAIAALLRKAILAWGVPEVIKTDNGSDYASRHIERAANHLGIRQDFCTPFTPQEKPHIERFFHTLSHQLFELLPGYVGHSVAERKGIENRRSFSQRLGESDAGMFQVDLDLGTLQARCDAWTDTVYGRDSHAGLQGRSPFEAAMAAATPARRVDNERALDVLLYEAADGGGIRVVGKKGLKVGGVTYIAGELGAHVGARVMVLLDREDIGRVIVYSADGAEFLCLAEAPEITGISRREVANEAKARHRAVTSAFRAEARRLNREVRPAGIAEEILAHAGRKAARVVALPQPSEIHDTPALAAAAEAAEVLSRNGRAAAIPEPTQAECETAQAVLVQLGGSASMDFDAEAMRLQRLKRLTA